MDSADITIIGNGILALSTAYALSRKDPHLKIVVVGPEMPDASASLAAGAMLGCFGEVTKYTLTSKAAAEKFRISRKADVAWPIWLESINQSLSHQHKEVKSHEGTFIILNTKSGYLDNENYQAIITTLDQHQFPYEKTNPMGIPDFNPVESARPLSALFLPKEKYINPYELREGLLQAISSNPFVSIINDYVVCINISSNGSKRVFLKQRSEWIEVEKLIIASGGGASCLIKSIPELSSKIQPLLCGVGSALLLHSDSYKLEYVVRTPNRAGSCGLHMLPQGNATYVGASNHLSSQQKSDPKLRYVYYLTQYAIEQLNKNFHNSSLKKILVGNRPVSLDTFPLIGSTSVPNLWLLLGTYRDGIHMSPTLAMNMAEQILSNAPPISGYFLPERDPISFYSKEDALNEFVKQAVSAAYEHSMDLPKYGLDEAFEEMLYRQAERTYEKLGFDLGLSPEVLLLLEREPDQISVLRNYLQNLKKSSSRFRAEEESAI